MFVKSVQAKERVVYSTEHKYKTRVTTTSSFVLMLFNNVYNISSYLFAFECEKLKPLHKKISSITVYEREKTTVIKCIGNFYDCSFLSVVCRTTSKLKN